jgi:drug/metabolite transporter (DMT)-like permease
MGVAVITLSKGFVVSEVFPTLAIVAAAFAQSIYSLCQKKLLGRYRPLQLTSYMIWIGTILLFPFTKNLWQQASTAPSQATIALVILGIVPSIVGYVSWNYALSMLSASKAGIVLYLLPVASLFISWVCLNEAPTLVSILGGSIVLMGVIFLSFSKSRQLKNAIST